MTGLITRSVTSEDWPLIERLFGERGACGGCWCMHWHAPPGQSAWEQMKGTNNRAALEAMVQTGECHAAIALDCEIPVGWCRVGPTRSFERLRRSRKLWRPTMADWAVVCFFVAASHRGRSVASQLLKTAVRLAFDQGARSVEGYPSLPRTGEIPAAFAWTGVPRIFEDAGFTALPDDAGARRIYSIHR